MTVHKLCGTHYTYVAGENSNKWEIHMLRTDFAVNSEMIMTDEAQTMHWRQCNE